MDIKKEREAFEDQIIRDGFVEHSGYSLTKNECEDYLDERVECAWFAYRQAFRRATEKAIPEGFVLVPMVPSERMIHAVRKSYEGETCLSYSLYSEFINQAIIERMEAQDQSNEQI